MYHRVADVAIDPWGMCVSPGHFAEQMEVLADCGTVVPLDRIVEAVEKKHLSRRVIAVTFDDGYADNLYTLRPLLERYQIAATVFVTTGALGDKRGFWWDELASIVLGSETLPETVSITVKAKTLTWKMNENTDSPCDPTVQRDSWKAWEKPRTSRHCLYSECWRLLVDLQNDDRLRILDDLKHSVGKTPGNSLGAPTLQSEELITLATSKVITVGAHSVTHPRLAGLNASLQLEEITRSRSCLEEITGQPVTGFAYPHGNFSNETVAILRREGFKYACGTTERVVGEDSDLFQLPRRHVLNWDGDVFAKNLSKWFALQ